MERQARIFLGIAIGTLWAVAGLMIYAGPPAKIVTPTLLAEPSPEKAVETAKADLVRAELERLRAEEAARQKDQWERWQADREKRAADHQKQIKDEERRQLARQQHERVLEQHAKAEAKQQADEQMRAAVAQEQINRRLNEANDGPPIKKPKAKRRGEVDRVAADDGLREYLREQHRKELREKYARRARKSLAARYSAVAAYEANARGVANFHAMLQARAIRGW